MGEDSKIEWTHHTMNPWISCTKVSPGCQNCYAETLENRWGRGWGPNAPRRRTSKNYWKQPYKWAAAALLAGERHRVFCASMADVFEDRDDLVEPRRDLFVMIERTPELDWLLLTKRPENMVKMTRRWETSGWPSNVWAGTSVENQDLADKRIPALRLVPAKIRFLSCEPLIGPITFRPSATGVADMLRLAGSGDGARPMLLDGISWVICGGESGHGARPMSPDWARYLRDQAREAGTAYFMKQMGGSRDKKGDLESIPEDLRIREFPKTGLTVL